MTFFKPIRCRWKGFSPSRSPFRSLHHFESGTSQCYSSAYIVYSATPAY